MDTRTWLGECYSGAGVGHEHGMPRVTIVRKQIKFNFHLLKKFRNWTKTSQTKPNPHVSVLNYGRL